MYKTSLSLTRANMRFLKAIGRPRKRSVSFLVREIIEREIARLKREGNHETETAD
jgi:predicted DNA-binding ribbon-helix-helix protein